MDQIFWSINKKWSNDRKIAAGQGDDYIVCLLD